MTETAYTNLTVSFNQLSDDSLSEFLSKAKREAEVCQNNLILQQERIDLWRSLAISGLLATP